MRLDKIKLAGFKSFADPTTIIIKGNLTAVVGPNGCGKSNIIDAVRWVMGESSAKHLRGNNIDVIFNGSATRPPVSVATVELTFDNHEGKAGGAYAEYSHISIKRQINHEGLSHYALNGTRCRRKDITDLFLGTGLGTRSYAIIEQGTISKMVESKPEELRVYIEEAAGISKYKERRRETQTCMRHTQENIARLDDLRDEVKKQLSYLKKQAKAAQKFATLKQQERQYKCELLAMRWRKHQQNMTQLNNQLQGTATEHQRLLVLLKKTEQSIATQHSQYKNQQQHLDTLQENYYNVLAHINNLQQIIKHKESDYQATVLEIERLQQQITRTNKECTQDTVQLESLQKTQQETQQQRLIIDDKLTHSRSAKAALQAEQTTWQTQWQGYTDKNAHVKEQAQVQQVKLSYIDQQSQQWQQRLAKIQTERHTLARTDFATDIKTLTNRIALLTTDRDDLQTQIATIEQQLISQQQHLKKQQHHLHQHRFELHAVNGKMTSLELLQQHATGRDKKELMQWLDTMGLSKNPRLAELLEVEAGWDKAVETVLNGYLEAVYVTDMLQIMPDLHTFKHQSLVLVQADTCADIPPTNSKHDLTPLLQKINAPHNLRGLLSGIYGVENRQTAIKQRLKLEAYESIITPEGDWIGRDWIKIPATDNKTEVLQREKTLRHLKQKHQQLQQVTRTVEAQLTKDEQLLKVTERAKENLHQKEQAFAAEYAIKNAQLSTYNSQQEQQQQRLNQMDEEIADIASEQTKIAQTTTECQHLQTNIEQITLKLATQKQGLEAENKALQSKQQAVDLRINETQTKSHLLQEQIASLKTTIVFTQKQIARLQSQTQQTTTLIHTLKNKLDTALTPLDDEKLQLKTHQDDKQKLEKTLQTERDKQQVTQTKITELTAQQLKIQQQIEPQKEGLDKIKFAHQDSQVRQQTVSEQLAEIAANPEQVLTTLSPTANEQEWQTSIANFSQQIEQLGAINLTAIDDYKAQSERIDFLNAQRADLTQALDTLNQAITQIDKESRQRFKKTFEQINENLQLKFPQLFGGGQACLTLTEANVLEAEVHIIAQPPGKKNNSIHLLSGGEKALTAVALIFSIFDLNPAPFCMLDEVDAPLDDANIMRFSQMIKAMSATVQFIYVSHNKVTMEIAKQLTGVTMEDAGVSRLVSVDIHKESDKAQANG